MERVINYDDWRVWEQNASPMLLTMTLNAGMRDLREYFGMALWTSVIIYEENQGRWLFRPSELKLLGQKMIDFLLCPSYRVAFFTGYQTAEEAVLRKARTVQFSTDLKTLTDDELVTLFEELCDLYYAWYKLGWFCEPVQFRGQEVLTAFLEKKSVAEEAQLDLPEARQVIFTVEEDTFAVEILCHLRDCATALAAALRNETLGTAMKDLREDANFPVKAAQAVLLAAESDTSESLQALIASAKEHSAKFYWKQNNYFSTRFITEEDVLIEILGSEGFDIQDPASRYEAELASIRENKEQLLDKKARLLGILPPYLRELAALLSSVGGSLLDKRKRTTMQVNAAFDRILGAVAERTETGIADCRLLIPQELAYFIASPAEYRHRLEARRDQFLVYQGDFPLLDEMIGDVSSQAEESGLTFTQMSMRDPFIAEGQLVEEVLERLDSRLHFLADQADSVAAKLQGVAAYYDPSEPIVSGKVTVIKDPKAKTLKSGTILVAPSTTPDYMNAIRLCKAIITDWGGQTSHAAITSRELKKPCIIGTNYASQVLQDGDEVRIDLVRGTIEVLP